MKNIIKKLKFHNTTYIFILIYFLCGYFKAIIAIFSVVLIHECGHVFMSLLCKYKIKRITIYPFGGITESEKLINSPIIKDFLVYLGGFIFQIIFFVFLNILLKNNLINTELYNVIKKYNYFILVFNLIPIIPLDGYLLLNLILNKLFSYYMSLRLSLIISVIFFIGFFYFYQNNYIIMGFLLYNSFIYYKNINYFYNKFLLERYLYSLSYNKIKYYKGLNLKMLSRECLAYFKENNKYINEKNILNKKFDNKLSFW